MKKLQDEKTKIESFRMGASELLTRAQLKNVLGGFGGSGSEQACQNECGPKLGDCPLAKLANRCLARILIHLHIPFAWQGKGGVIVNVINSGERH